MKTILHLLGTLPFFASLFGLFFLIDQLPTRWWHIPVIISFASVILVPSLLFAMFSLEKLLKGK
jgi:hypothetical protein